MAKSIFGIQEEYFETMYELEVFFQENPDHMGDIPDEFMERLNINKDEMIDKLRNYELAIRSIEAERLALKEERERLYLVSKAKENVVNRLKGIMIQAVEKFGTTNGKTATKFIKGTFINHQARYLKPLVIEDEGMISPQYKNIKIDLTGNQAELMTLISNVIEALPDDQLKRSFRDWINFSNRVITPDKKLIRKDIMEGKIEETDEMYIDAEKATLYLMKPSASKK